MKHITPEELKRLAADQREAGNECTAEDLERAAFTIQKLAERIFHANKALGIELAEAISSGKYDVKVKEIINKETLI